MLRMTWSFKAGARHKWRRRTRPRSREPAHVTHCATFADASLLHTLCGIRSMACLSQCTWMSDASNSSLREIFVVTVIARLSFRLKPSNTFSNIFTKETLGQLYTSLTKPHLHKHVMKFKSTLTLAPSHQQKLAGIFSSTTEQHTHLQASLLRIHIRGCISSFP